MRICVSVLVLTAMLSAVSWGYRFVEEHARAGELWFYVLVPLLVWLMFAGPLLMLLVRKTPVRVIAVVLLIPTALLWSLSVLIGFTGLKIH